MTIKKDMYDSEKAVELRKKMLELQQTLEEMRYRLYVKDQEFRSLNKEYVELLGIKEPENENNVR